MKNYKKNSALACAAFAVFLFTTGCHHKKAEAPEPPAPPAETTPAPTANITVTPDTVTPGQSAALNWTTTNATDVSIDGIGAVETSGTKTVSPTDTTTYHLVARGDGGSTDATA
ncbi:MAG: flagellar motor protein MotB, partial [Acidobacteriota bacterium]